MAYIKLECKTAGFPFGEVVEVGSQKGQIAKKIADELVSGSQAKMWNKPVSGASAALKGEVTKLTNTNKALVDEIADLTKQLEDANKALEEATKPKGK